jgi:EAL domain-containing protein (putative c-di-GMP-specific phosphodiesterase class I)
METIGCTNKNELMLFYQPQIVSRSGELASVEALIRRNHSERGILGASETLAAFNTSELMEQLDWWVLEEACREMQNFKDLHVGINISATQLHKPDFAIQALGKISEFGIEPVRLQFEIVETAFIDNFDAAIRNINVLREAGLRIALDDFGTGYSSLSYLLRIPIDTIKIDKCFIDNFDTVQSSAVIQAIVALARAIGIRVTAEGVETVEQQNFLRSIGCHYMQGYLYAKPGPISKISSSVGGEVGRLTGGTD